MFSDHYQYHDHDIYHDYIEDDDIQVTSTKKNNINYRSNNHNMITNNDDSKVTSDSKDTTNRNNNTFNNTINHNNLSYYRPQLCIAIKDGYEEIIHNIYNIKI